MECARVVAVSVLPVVLVESGGRCHEYDGGGGGAGGGDGVGGVGGDAGGGGAHDAVEV